MYLETFQTVRRKVWQWLKGQIAQDVPEEDALCEYDCRKQQCTEEEWATCERRIHKAAGELWPESGPEPYGEATRYAKTSETAPQSPEAEGLSYRPIPLSQSTTSSHGSINADDISDAALHNEIKCRAYELYQRQRDNTDGHDSNDKLRAELPCVAYAAAELQKYSKGEVADTRSVRAARVYLRALSFFISNREHGLSKQRSEPRIR
ncbi:MAG: hypothetical protein WAN19_17900 [Candidatus Sulfotelmatobacter sp.]